MTETIGWDTIETPIGEVACAVSEAGVVAITFLSEARRGSLEGEVPGKPKLVRDAEATRQIKNELGAYFAGEITAFQSQPDLRGTPFQVSVWKRLLDITYGATATYGAVARKIGNPEASRAVGMANNKNRISILVPCHRVVGSTGDLTGYGGGLDRKKWLLDHEIRVAMKGKPLSC